MTTPAAPKRKQKKGESAEDIIRVLPQRYVERFPLAELEDFPGNPKDHDIGAINESIDANGWYGALIVQEWPDTPKYILAGHGRRDTLIGKGVTHVAVLFIECDEKTARRIVLADNRTSQLGGFDLPALAAFVTEDAKLDNLKGTGYDGDDVDAINTQLTSDYQNALGTSDEGKGNETPATSEAPRPAFVLFSQQRVIDEAFAFFRERGFPYRDLPLHIQLQEMNALAALDQDKALRSTRGYAVADTYHKHRFHATARNKSSPFDSFMDDEKLRHALKLEIEMGPGHVSDKMFGTLSLVRGTQACANFRPAWAMALYREFVPQGGVVLDPCTGYGGRLTGFIASKLGGTYVGTDPNTPTYQANVKLADTLARDLCTVELHHLPFEDFAREHIDGERFDFAFTSPPYFGKELYSDEPTQSRLRYPSIDSWRTGFLRELMRGCFRGLKAGSFCVINIADVDIGGQTYPLEQMTVEEGESEGFEHVETRNYSIAIGAGKGDQGEGREPAFVFRKPTR